MQRTMTVGDRKPGRYTYESIKQRLSGVKWNIAFAIDRLYVQVGMANNIVICLLYTRFMTPSIKLRLPMAITIEISVQIHVIGV